MGGTASDRESDGERQRIREVAQMLRAASRGVKILRALDWPGTVREEFFARGAGELPRVSYAPFDADPVLRQVEAARRLIGSGTPIEDWLDRQARSVEVGARMLGALGTPAFLEYGRQAYGTPTSPSAFESGTPLSLAKTVHDRIAQLDHIKVEYAPASYRSGEEVAQTIEAAVNRHFGADAPRVELVDELSAKALASGSRIRVRRGARFTDRDAASLLNHEAYVHACTAINGRAQADLPILGVGHPCTARTQEGLAVFAEIISGTIELDRLRRLADRVFAIQMAIDGADFLDVHRYFLERTGDPEQSFENARRVFRGGVLTGGAPFTKDVVYLYGLLQVTNVMRAVFSAGRTDCLLLLFCGKLELADLPALCQLTDMGLCRLPRHVPPWVSDPRYLLAMLTYSEFTHGLESEGAAAHVTRLLEAAPVVDLARARQERQPGV